MLFRSVSQSRYKDKNGKEIYEDFILRIKVFMGENKEYYSDAYYRVNKLTYWGLSLSFLSMADNNPSNQVPICQSPSFEYHSLCTDNRNNNYDRIALSDTWGENQIFHTRWQENHYSNDIEIVGSTYNPPKPLN